MSLACAKSFSITIDPADDCPDWNTVVWTGTPGNPPAEFYDEDGGTITRNFVGGNISFDIKDMVAPSFYGDALGTLAYTGAGCNCNAHVYVYINPLIGEAANAGLLIKQDGVTKCDIRWIGIGTGGVTVDIPFTLAAAPGGSTITIEGRWFQSGHYIYTNLPPQLPGEHNIYQVTITNV